MRQRNAEIFFWTGPPAEIQKGSGDDNGNLLNLTVQRHGKLKSLDPEEDTYRKQLDELYTVKFVRNACEQLHARGHSYDSLVVFGEEANEENDILASLKNTCTERAMAAFDKSDIIDFYLKRRKFYEINRASRAYEDETESRWNKALEEVYLSNCAEENGSGWTIRILMSMRSLGVLLLSPTCPVHGWDVPERAEMFFLRWKHRKVYVLLQNAQKFAKMDNNSCEIHRTAVY